MKLALSLYTAQEPRALSPHKNDLICILGFKEVSRFFEYSQEECLLYAQKLKEAGLQVFLQWDILMSEDIFGGLFFSLKNKGVFNSEGPFAGIRVQDPGLLYALKEENYQGKIHFITENGNHNLIGLKSWLKVWPEAIERLVVSSQLPAKTLLNYANILKSEFGVDLEVLGLGPILLFYTPRKLVSPMYGDEEETYRVSGTSEESPHKGFPIIENRHGTFMLNTKDQFLFEELLESQRELAYGPSLSWRIDPICGSGSLNIPVVIGSLIQKDLAQVSLIKDAYQRPVTKGFFRVNKTDVLFKKLKNHRLQDRDDSFVGEVVDVKKKTHIAVLVKGDGGLKLGDELRLLSPEGREKFVTVDRMTDALSQSLSDANKGQIVFIPPLGGISVRSMVYQQNI